METERIILAEALTALVGITVKFQSEVLDSCGVKLDVTNLPASALLGYDEYFSLKASPVSYLTSLLARWFIGDQSQASQETLNKSSSSSSDEDDLEIINDFLDSEFDFDVIQTSYKTPNKESTSSLRKELFVIPDDFFDPGYDFDFTHMSESKSDSDCKRGNEPYKRPYGWMRFALKVRDKYPDGNAWLGTGGWRNRSDRGEWPVSYHGTSVQGAEGIIKTHYKVGHRNIFGRGIYSSPDVKMAETFSKTFKSQKNGKTYEVIMQNRVNPKRRETFNQNNIWLVPIPEGTSAAKEKEIVESSIRPYGLLLKEV